MKSHSNSQHYIFQKDKVIAVITYRGSNAVSPKVIKQLTGTFEYYDALLFIREKVKDKVESLSNKEKYGDK